MKKNKLYIIAFLTLLGCSKDIESVIIDSFDYKFDVIAKSSGYVFQDAAADFRIVPERIVTTTKYNFNYSIEGGEGYFIDSLGNTIKPRIPIDLQNFSWKMNYMPLTTGEHNIKMTVEDNKGRTEKKSIFLSIKENDFEILTTPAKTNEIENVPVDVVVDLSEELVSDRYTYEAYYSSTKNSHIVVDEKTILPGEKFKILPGKSNFQYFAEDEGNHSIFLTLESSNGQKKTNNFDIDFERYEEDFDFTLNAASGIKTKDNDFLISTTINAMDGHSPEVTYEMSFKYTNGAHNGVVESDTNTYREGEIFNTRHGFYGFDFKSFTEDDFQIEFTVTNSTGVTKKKTLDIDMYMKPKISGVLTWYFGDNKRSCGNGCNWDYHYLVKMDIEKDPSADRIDVFIIQLINNRANHPTRGEYQEYTISFNNGIKRNDFHEFHSPTFVPTGESELYDGQKYILKVRDSNGIENSIEGIFTNDKNDGQ